MLKKRIIPKFLISQGRLVKGVRFHENFREAGNPVSTAKVYDSYGVDELLFVDIDATPQGRPVVGSVIERISEEVFMPFTVGGGIKTIEQIGSLLASGADKVCINTSAIEDPNFILRAASRFGDQCIVVGIDYQRQSNGFLRVVSHCGSRTTELDPIDWAQRMQELHAGEIMLCSVDRDGTMTGYDIDLIAEVSERLEVPLIASSGAGSLQHCRDALEAGASAITISSMFLFTDHSPIKVRSYLSSNGLSVRAQKGSQS
jgi:cyclase